MLELKDYDTYYTSGAGTTVYPGLLIEKASTEVDLSLEKLEPVFIQGKSAFKVEGVEQNPVYHSQICGKIIPFIARNGQIGRYERTDGADLLVSGEAVTGNCKRVVNIGDRIEVTECYLHTDSPTMSLFHLYTAERIVRLSRVRFIFTCLICYQRKGVYTPVARISTTAGQNIIYDPYQTYDAAYIKTLVPEATKIQATSECLRYFREDLDGTPMRPSPQKRIDIESDFQLILSTFRNKFKAFNALLMNGPHFIDPLYEFRMGYCADAAVQGNLFVVESNMLEMWKEILAGSFGSEIKDWSQAISKFSKNRKGTTKRVAKSYLSTTYGSQLTLNDMEQWKNAITKYMWRSFNARDTAHARARDSFQVGAPDFSLKDGAIDYNYSLIYDPLEKFGGNLDIKNTLRSFRLTPNEKRTWEIIPFSFVVDWFVPISDYLAVIESENTIFENRYRILGEVNSVKMRFPFKEHPQVELVAYVRKCSTFPITKPFPNLEELNPSKRGVSGSAYLSGTALILSKGKAKPKNKK